MNKINNKGISYCINRNIELISVIMLLSEYYKIYPYLKTRYDLNYTHEIISYFNDYSYHPAIKKFNRLAENGFTFSFPLEVVLNCDEEMNLQKEYLSENNKINRQYMIQIKSFLNQLNVFAKISNFDNFFSKYNDYYDYILNKNAELIPDINFKKILTEYYGTSPNQMEVILAVTFGGVGYSITSNAKKSIILGTFSTNDNVPIVIDKEYFIKMTLHEFSHSYINLLIDHSKISAECCNKLYNILDKGYQEQYGNGNSLVSEQVVKAVTARLVSIYSDQDQGKGLIEYEKSQNFIAVEPLCYCLKNEYEKNREKYQYFNKFIPEILDTLEKI